MAHQDFVALKTPPTAGHGEAPPPPPARSPAARATGLATVLRLGALLCLGAFFFGNIATWAPLYESKLINTFTKWWRGYPHGDAGGVHANHAGSVMDTGVQRDIWHTGHTEMVRPTFLLLFCILPFFVGILLIEALQCVAPARRLTRLLWKSAMVLRRKPRLPLLGVSRLTMGEWLFGVVFVVGGNVLCFWYEWDRRIASAKKSKILTTTKYYNIIGISCAYVCIYNMAFLLLPVTRNCVWMEFFNVSYANGVKLHRWVGFATVLTAVVHTAGYWVKWVRDGTWRRYQLPCTSCDLTDEYTGYYAWFNTFGFVAVLALVLMIPTSLPAVRRKAYEWFYLSHWVLFLISFFFAVLHWAQIIWWILPAGLLFFISRAASSWNAFAPVRVDALTVVSGELAQLVVQRATTRYDYQVGNFVYINVPHISKLQWHALTIASSPKTSATQLTLLIKPVGDWSQQLVKYAHECEAAQQAPVVYMDGFYGSSLEGYDEYATLCLVGGGIGVTPLLAILEDIAAKVAAGGGAWTQPRVVFTLAFRELSLLRAVAPVLLKLQELDVSGECVQLRLFGTREPTDAELDATFTSGSSDSAQAKQATARGGGAPAPRAFYEPLRSSAKLRVALFVAIYLVAIVVVTAARWGNGAIQGDNHPALWPFERAFEMVVFCATIVVAYAFIWYEFQTMRGGDGGESPRQATDRGVETVTVEDVHAMRDVATRLGVVFGARPQLQTVLHDALALHASFVSTATVKAAAVLPTVGVFVSGPERLKMAANDAVAALGQRHFDVHEEEFEL